MRAPARPEPRQAHHPPPNFPRFPARSSLTCCGAQVPASVMQSRLRSLARPRPAGPALPPPALPPGTGARAGHAARGESRPRLPAAPNTDARGRGRERPAEGGGGNEGSGEEAQMGCGRRGDDQYKQEIPSSPPGLHRGLERSSGCWLGGDTQ